MFIDSHAHLSMLINERKIHKDQIIQELNKNNVNTVLNISGNSRELSDAFELEEEFSLSGIKILHAAGVHPHEARKDYSWIRENASKIVAIGEVGLDFYYDFSPRKDQEKVFRNMILLSIELNKPLIIHGRDAEERVVSILDEQEKEMKKVLFHCYTGKHDTALKIIGKNWLISFSGILTFKKSIEFHNILKDIGLNKVMFETDSPFLAPVPFRGKVNTPGKVYHVYEFASELLDINIGEIEQQVAGNFKDLFEVNL